MTRYIALLRGINVGSRRVKMERLRALFDELGLHNIRSFINSGNIFFDTDRTDRQQLTQMIEQHLQEELGFEVAVFLRTLNELAAILSQQPFKDIILDENTRFCVVFTNDVINQTQPPPVHSSKNDMEIVAVNQYEAFVVWHIINQRPPSGTFSREVLPTPNTSRFFHTLGKMRDAAEKNS